jgi:hypothetical protein
VALSDRDAPYLLTILVAGLGWIVTFIADQYSAVPTLEIQKTLETAADKTTEAKFFFTNVSRKSIVTIDQLDFLGDVTLVPTKSPCAKFISVAPYRVADVNPPFTSAGPRGSEGYCFLPMSLKHVELLPGASFGVQLVFNGQGKLNPYIVENHAQLSAVAGPSDTSPFRIVWADSIDACIARYLNQILLFGGLLASILTMVLLLLKKGDK